jgi:hypothetical protein
MARCSATLEKILWLYEIGRTRHFRAISLSTIVPKGGAVTAHSPYCKLIIKLFILFCA